MNTRHQIDSYLPEISFLDGKQERSTRVCTERCAVLDVFDEARILAARGQALVVGNSFYTALSMTESERQLFQKSLRTHRRFFILAGKTTVLVLADWLCATGLCIVILPSSSPAAIRAALRATERTDIVDLLGEEIGKALIRERREAHAHLLELLRYIDALFDPCAHPSHLLPTVASFAGCRTAQHRLKAKEDDVGRLGSRTVAFLLCSLLSIRAASGTVESYQAHGVPIRTTLEYTTPTQAADGNLFPFLRAGCFDGYRIERRGNVYTITFPEKTPISVGAGSMSRLTLCIELLPCAV